MKFNFSDYSFAAQVGTDLVNTSPEVRTVGDALADPDAVARFLTEHELRTGIITHGDAPSTRDVDDLHVLRREIRSILEMETEDAVAHAANALVERAGTGPFLDRDDSGRWQWYVATPANTSLGDELAVLVGTGLLGVLHTLSHDRFRHCTASDCRGVFVDTSKAGRRRYCMPGVCGNRRNVASYRARQLAADKARTQRKGRTDA
ncbi:CGNR zinc finger domain-containing protein [Streptomyces longisporoflavus]|uniref:CGNR zinc finger domain-containing protein n=1 Tax=Streptomyces longisporoflavus TaxID=28044 RepID=A0ABW7R2R1_9ACTN